MKKHLRKLSALLLTLVLAISLAPAALAAPANTDITFDGVMAGDTVMAYPMVTYDTTYSSFTYHPAFKTFLDGKKGAAGTLDAWFSALASDVLSGYLTEYTEKVQAGTAGYDLPMAKVEDTVATGATSTTLSLAPGFYLVLTRTTAANSKVYTPVAVFARVMADHSVKVYAGGTELPAVASYTITMKSEAAPVITKLVRNNLSDLISGTHYQPTASSSVGTYHGLDFVIKVTIPLYAGDPHFSTLTIKDTLKNAALTTNDFSTVSIHRTYDATYGSFGGNLNAALKTATSSIGTYAAGKQDIVLDLDYNVLKNTTPGATETVFYIQYHARLQKDAIDTDTLLTSGGKTNMGKNTAALTYELATDLTEKTTDPVSTSVYTYSVKLEKKDADGNALTGAKFRLYSDDTMTAEVGLVKDATGGFYYPADVGVTGDEIDTDTGNSFLIKGLEQGTYYLKETATKAGFYLPKGGFKIVLAGEGNATTDRKLTGKLAAAYSTFTATDAADNTLIGTVSVDTTAVNQLDIVLKNSSQPILPSTGGMGTALFTFGGVALMVLAAGLTIYMRKRKES
mgnify:CR=1 FL=1